MSYTIDQTQVSKEGNMGLGVSGTIVCPGNEYKSNGEIVNLPNVVCRDSCKAAKDADCSNDDSRCYGDDKSWVRVVGGKHGEGVNAYSNQCHES